MTNQEIKTTGQTIAQETQIGGNTAGRVGGVIEGIGVALDNKDAANGYYQATINGGSISVNAPNYVLGTGGNLRLKMPAAGTTASTLTIGNANAVQLWYNGAAVSSDNTWEQGEIISVFYDGTRFMASNSQGGGGNAEKIKYNNSQSGLNAENVQEAIDETAIGLKTLEQTSPINTDSEAESDLDIADEFGRVLARFENGNIKTKNFNSANAVEAETYPTISEDLDITDENKKVLARFKNGHIQTKYFDSSVGRGAYSSSTIRFEVDVNVNMLKDSVDSASVQDSYVGTYKDNGLLMLPPTYTPQGKPTRLVIAFHGAGGGASDHDSQTEQQTQYKYLVANGYAVMDMNGMPADWVETWWSDCPVPAVKEYCKVNNMGTSLAMECYVKGYEWVIDNYNIARDGVFICGGSMGGMSSSNFVMMGSVPVIAQAIYAPALDTYNQAFLHPWTPVSNPILSKYCLGKLYGFSKDGNDQYIYDADKVNGYNPIINGMESYANGERVTSVGTYEFTTHYLNGVAVTEYKRYPCPLKIWHCDNDPTVNIACSIRQVTAIKNAGGMAWLRRFPSGGHAPDTAGTIVSNPSGNTILNGASVGTIYPLAEETLLFFNRFNNK